ncbi:hypothetical protein E2C01_097740 [Portunus trituberculatus]|uniref:Uncharacterized protein n=1 Tax=Portunus trituberculatus TaxID=210409 RepID=A0A5B7KAT9_PORTR|nr:hypothetical protein [Portunus trituberculatus]
MSSSFESLWSWPRPSLRRQVVGGREARSGGRRDGRWGGEGGGSPGLLTPPSTSPSPHHHASPSPPPVLRHKAPEASRAREEGVAGGIST